MTAGSKATTCSALAQLLLSWIQEARPMHIFEAIQGFRAAEREGDWLRAECWLRHLEFLRDLQRLTAF
jgi:hypothetical protein